MSFGDFAEELRRVEAEMLAERGSTSFAVDADVKPFPTAAAWDPEDLDLLAEDWVVKGNKGQQAAPGRSRRKGKKR